MEILAMDPQMVSQVTDPRGQQGNLDVAGAGVFFVGLIPGDDILFIRDFCHGFSFGSRSGTTLNAGSVETARAVSTAVIRFPEWTEESDHNRWPDSDVRGQHQRQAGNPQAKKWLEISPGTDCRPAVRRRRFTPIAG